MNRLRFEKSPYLLQHQNNPVKWFPWGEEAFEKAQKESKPIFLSIGYSTCYWCHVMERECFEREDVAEILNAHYVSIKVDREERPDIDKIYMDAVISLTGHGGWPLSAILTPELKPFFAGTYIPRPQFMQLLEKVNSLWSSDPERILESAEGITEGLKATNRSTARVEVGDRVFSLFLEQAEQSFDSEFGGFGDAPKFPPSGAIELLLRIYRRSGNESAFHMATKTLEKMARGGIFDQLGGGFHRYSTDEQWLVPHFEKMLYDNALLVHCYLEGYQVTGNELFKEVAVKTLNYVLTEMCSPEGGFYSAQDAGEVGREGEFFVWKEEELEHLLSPEEFATFKSYYAVTSLGNFENNFNVLHIPAEVEWAESRNAHLDSACAKILAARNERIRPHLDDKVISSWNALMISAFSKAYQVLGEVNYLNAAQNCAKFISDKLFVEGTLYRRYREGETKYRGFLEDYSYLIQALLDLYESDFNVRWYIWAKELQQNLDRDFWDSEERGYFLADSSDSSAIVRTKDLLDGAIPSGNSISLLNLSRLYAFSHNESYLQRAEELVGALSGFISRYPTALARAVIAYDFFSSGVKQVAIVGEIEEPLVAEVLKTLHRDFIPNRVIALDSSDSGLAEVPEILSGRVRREGNATVYLCHDQSCELPETEYAQVEANLKKVKPLTLS